MVGVPVAAATAMLLVAMAAHPQSPAYLGFLFPARDRSAAMRAPGHGLSGFIARKLMQKANEQTSVHIVQNALGVRKGQTVVELGPGSGYGLRPILGALGPGGRAVAIEISPSFQEELAESFDEDLQSGRLEIHGDDAALHMRQKMSDASVDGILGSNVVYFLNPLDEYLAQFYRVLKPGGILVFGVKNMVKKQGDPSIFVNVDWNKCVQAMERAGFEAEEHSLQLEGLAQYIPLVGIKRGHREEEL